MRMAYEQLQSFMYEHRRSICIPFLILLLLKIKIIDKDKDQTQLQCILSVAGGGTLGVCAAFAVRSCGCL